MRPQQNPNDLGARWEGTLARLTPQIDRLFTGLADGIGRVRNSMQQFVAAANPAAAERLNVAFRDLQGVVGRVLTPALEKVTAITRALADTIQSLSEPVKELLGGLALGSGLAGAFTGVIATVGILVRTIGGVPLLLASIAGAFLGVITEAQGFAEVADQARQIFSQVAGLFSAVASAVAPPLIRVGGVLVEVAGALLKAVAPLVAINFAALGDFLTLVASAFELLAPALVAAANGVAWLTRQLLELVNQIRVFFGLSRIETTLKAQAGGSVGAGVRPASVGSVEQLVNSQIARSFGAGLDNKAKTDTGKLLDTTNEMQKDFKAFRDTLRGWLLDELPAKLQAAFKELVSNPGQVLRNATELPAGDVVKTGLLGVAGATVVDRLFKLAQR